MDYKKRAFRAKELLRNDDFLAILQDLRDRQMEIFANTAAQETDKREEAHAVLRALNQIKYLLQADVDAEKLIEKKGSAPQWRLNPTQAALMLLQIHLWRQSLPVKVI